MKKEYIKPEVYALNMAGSTAILSASNNNDNTIPGGSSNVIPKGGENRGQWGNIWGE